MLGQTQAGPRSDVHTGYGRPGIGERWYLLHGIVMGNSAHDSSILLHPDSWSIGFRRPVNEDRIGEVPCAMCMERPRGATDHYHIYRVDDLCNARKRG